MIRDLTEGKPGKLIISFMLPVLLGNLFQQFYSIADSIIVGQYLGDLALAAVGGTGSISFLVIGFIMGLAGGFAIPVSQRFGAKDYSSMRKYAWNMIYLSLIFSVVVTAITVTLCRPLLNLMSTPADIIDSAQSYIIIIFWGIPLCILYNCLSWIIRSLGDSRTPVYILLVSSVLNIVLDIVMITVFSMGTAGAAAATVISQGLSVVLCIILIRKKFPILDSTKDERRIDTKLWGNLCANGIPMGLQYSITAIGSVILQANVNTLGSSAVAAITIGQKINGFAASPFDALATTCATWGGQNTGAGKIERIQKGLVCCIIIGAVWSAIAFIIIYFFSGQLCTIFVDSTSTEIISNASRFLIANSASYFFLVLVNTIRLMIQGIGFGNVAIFSGVFEMIARIIVGTFGVPALGFTAACFASPLAWLAADIYLIPAYTKCLSILKKRREARPAV